MVGLVRFGLEKERKKRLNKYARPTDALNTQKTGERISDRERGARVQIQTAHTQVAVPRSIASALSG